MIPKYDLETDEIIFCLVFSLPVFSNDGAGQQCCYDIDGYLMMTSDSMWGGNPHRAHNLGMRPFYEANKVPAHPSPGMCVRWRPNGTAPAVVADRPN